jgi:hypothetical protein
MTVQKILAWVRQVDRDLRARGLCCGAGSSMGAGLDKPVLTLLLLGMVIVLRGSQISLTKYAYLTQIGVPTLLGAITAGPGTVCLALGAGVFAADVLWVRKSPMASTVNATREVTAFAAAFGLYAGVLAVTKPSGHLAGLPARGCHPGDDVLLPQPFDVLLHPSVSQQAGRVTSGW